MRNPSGVVMLVVSLAIIAGCMTPGGPGAVEAHEFGRPERPSPRAKAYSHYLSSIFLEQQGKFEEALSELEKVPALDPQSVTPTLRLIRAHLRMRDYDQALEMAERAVKQAPERSNLWIVLGEIYHQLKRFDDATEAFTKAIELNPDNILGYGALVELQENTNDLVAAIDIYHRLIELNPTSAGLQYQLGINLIRISDAEGARAALTKALELSSSLVRAHYFLGVLALEAGENGASVDHLEQYLRVRPEDTEAQQMLAAVLARTGAYEQSLAIFQRLLAGAEVQPHTHIGASYVALLNDQPELAERLLPPDGAPIISTFVQAVARQEQGLPHQPLVESLDTVEGDVHDETEAYFSDLFYLFGREQAGQALLAKIQEFETLPVTSRVLTVLEARTLMALDRPADAVAVLNEILEKYPDFEWTHYYLAVAHDELKHFEETERHLKAYLETHPDDPDMLNFLAYLYADNGVNLDEAEALLQRALSSDPENPYYLDSLGWVYYKKGMAEQAVELIQRAIYGMETDDAVLRDHLGDAFLLKGDVQRALSEWERAVRLDPDLSGVKDKIESHRKATGVSALAI